ncbi:MAG: hypothetical protein QHH07_05265 [Sedimentisphaerales bacterium]|nr:hypothetical protein [Sedimentisphaerales bacterium]
MVDYVVEVITTQVKDSGQEFVIRSVSVSDLPAPAIRRLLGHYNHFG